MALPSAVTVGSVAFVVAAGVGLAAAVTSNAQETEPSAETTPATEAPTRSTPAQTTPSQKPDPKPDRRKPKKRTQPDDAVPKVFVEVYNNSGISGLAADRSAQLQGAGWNVAATDNWYGEIPANTVYYPAELEDEAQKLGKELGIDRLRSAISPMRFDRLTVILTSE